MLPKTIAAKPKVVQISKAYPQRQERSATLPRNNRAEIWPEKPGTKEQISRSSERARTLHIS
jgi:hypothetical protein